MGDMSRLVQDMTHDDIAEWAANRIRRMGYPYAFANLTNAMMGEQPDVLGMDYLANSIVIEVKVSRSDFMADQKKPWRQEGKGFGHRRVYLTPAGLLNADEIPYGWELWEVHGKTRPVLKVVKGLAHVKEGRFVVRQYKNIDDKEFKYFANQHSSYQKEAMWALKILNRMKKAGYPIEHLANGKKLKQMKGAAE